MRVAAARMHAPSAARQPPPHDPHSSRPVLGVPSRRIAPHQGDQDVTERQHLVRGTRAVPVSGSECPTGRRKPRPTPISRPCRSRTRCVCPRPRAASPSGPPGRPPAPGRARRVLPARLPAVRRPVTRVGDLDPDPGPPEQHPQNGRAARVHDRVRHQLGDQQDQRLGERLVVPYARARQPRPGPPAGPADLGGIRSYLQLNLKHLHRSHHPNRRTLRLATDGITWGYLGSATQGE